MRKRFVEKDGNLREIAEEMDEELRAAREEIKWASCDGSNICDWPIYAAVEYGKENCGLLLPEK